MRKFMAGLLAVAALMTLSVSSVEARGFRGGRCHGGSCGVGFGGCGSGSGVVVSGCPTCGGSAYYPGTITTWQQPQFIPQQGTEYLPQQPIPQAQTPIRVTDNQGRVYYLVPQSQYEKLAAPK